MLGECVSVSVSVNWLGTSAMHSARMQSEEIVAYFWKVCFMSEL